MSAPDVRIIAGPTGAGKSALAMHLARIYGARIISADSRQIYRDFDIGTAKPSRADRLEVPHAGLDVADPAERWNAATWAEAARRWLAEDAAMGRPSLIVGGTGLWLQALVRPLADAPPLDPGKRTALQVELGSLGTQELRRWVERLDPARAHLGRVQLLRAVEVALLSGTPLTEWHARGSAHPRRRARWLIVDPGAVLDVRLNQRRAEMLEAGWLDEVHALDLRYPGDLPAWNACGYREIRAVVQGTLALQLAVEQVRRSTRQYAKRQRTWFRHQLEEVGPVLRLDPTAADAHAVAEHWFREGET